jgi:hypothetical protein
MTKNYILMRKEHGELILMMNKQINLINSINIESKEDVVKESLSPMLKDRGNTTLSKL